MKALLLKLLGKSWEKIKGRGWKTWATAIIIGIGAAAEAMGLTEVAGWIPKILAALGWG